MKDLDGQISHFVGIEDDIKMEKANREIFARQLIDSQEQERKRIANEMHDALGQDMIIIKNTALLGLGQDTDISEKSSRLKVISDTASNVIEDIRKIARYLSPYQLDRLGLSKALESIPDTIAKTTEIRFSYIVDPIDELFPPENEIHIFRILQECVNNLVKHSDAGEAMVIVKREHDQVSMIIKDDGKGFDYRAIKLNSEHKQGIGLHGLEERVRILNGNLEIISEIGMGTKLTIQLPIQKGVNKNGK